MIHRLLHKNGDMIRCELRVAIKPRVASYFYELRVSFYQNKLRVASELRFNTLKSRVEN